MKHRSLILMALLLLFGLGGKVSAQEAQSPEADLSDSAVTDSTANDGKLQISSPRKAPAEADYLLGKWILVVTADEFYHAVVDSVDASGNHNANIRILSDIDLSSLPVSDDDYIFNFTFSGKIDGEKYDTGQMFDSRLYGTTHMIFKTLDNAEIRHIVICSCSFDGLDTRSGMLAETVQNETNIHDIIFSDVAGMGNHDFYDADRMGTVCGYATDSHFTNIQFWDCTNICDGSYVGFVAGEAYNCTVDTCATNEGCELWADGNITSDNSAYVGGMLGYADGCTLNYCINNGLVSSDDDRIGGIIGFGTNSTVISDCINAGVVKHCTRDGWGRTIRRTWASSLATTGIAALCSSAITIAFKSPGISDIMATSAHTAEEGVKQNLKQILITGRNWTCQLLKAKGPGWAVTTVKALTNKIVIGQYINNYASWKSWNKGEISLYKAFQGVPAASEGNNHWYTSTSTWEWIYTGTSFIGGMFMTNPYIDMTVAPVAITASTLLTLYDLASSPDELGGIAGTLKNGCYVRRCTNGGTVRCSDDDGGGIVGYLSNSTVESCYNRGYVYGGTDTGGIVGENDGGTVKYCLNIGAASNNDGSYGNIVGNDEDGTYASNYYLSDKNDSSDPGQIAFTQDKLPTGEIAAILNRNTGSTMWRQNLRINFYPLINDTTRAVVTAPIEFVDSLLNIKVYDAADFYCATANPYARICLQNDIVLGNNIFKLASSSTPFQGTVNGNGYSLYNCTHTEPGVTNYNQHNDCALFSYARKATFRNLNLINFNIVNSHSTDAQFHKEAILVANSEECEYDSVRLRDCSIKKNSNSDLQYYVGGIVAMSTNDTFRHCSSLSSTFESYIGLATLNDANVGGLVGLANGSRFISCVNTSTVSAEDNHDGGIVGCAHSCYFADCFNSGHVIGQEYVAGIAGIADKGSTILRCVNCGVMDEDEGDRNDYRGGIVGVLGGSESRIDSCFNYGSINFAKDDNCGPVAGPMKDGAAYGAFNRWYCQYNGSHIENMETGLYDKLRSGQWAYENKWCQSIDNDPFFTTLPVGTASAGAVYKNILCDGTVSYSNIYHSTASHDPEGVSAYGMCEICGKVGAAPKRIYIREAADLVALATATNHGVDYSNTVIRILNDIDMSSVKNFMPIGKDENNPFRGRVDGQNYRIRNLVINRQNGNIGTGLFGCVLGATIQGIIMDSSCTISSNGTAVAGIVGCQITPEGTTTASTTTVSSCGNEATVNGYYNAAGIVGGNYNDEYNVVTIRDCYNTGSINGHAESAAIMACGGNKFNVTYSWNSGDVTGYVDGHALVEYPSDATTKGFVSCFQRGDLPDDNNAISASSDNFENGRVCNELNYSGSWEQNLGTDNNPRLGDGGIYHKRAMTANWGTVVLPYYIYSNDSIQLYSVESFLTNTVRETINLKAVDEVAPNTPCFFKYTKPGHTDVTFRLMSSFDYDDTALETGNGYLIDTKAGDDEWVFLGLYFNLADQSNVYYLASDKLWYADKGVNIPAYRAILANASDEEEEEEGSSSKSLVINAINDDGLVDRLGEINDDGNIEFYEGPAYNITGQRVDPTTRGFIIRDGHKYLNR